MNGTRLTWLMLGLGIATATPAETEIHRCTDADGGTVYSQLPCAPDKPAEVATEPAEEAPENPPAENAEQELRTARTDEQPPKSAAELAACKKQFRDQIDAIDAEIQRDYAQEKADDYKQRLLQLTRQLRQC